MPGRLNQVDVPTDLVIILLDLAMTERMADREDWKHYRNGF